MVKSLIKLVGLDVHGFPESIRQRRINRYLTSKELVELLFVIAAKIIRIQTHGNF